VKCDRCQQEATVHEVAIKSGTTHERHLCEQCAKAAGLPTRDPGPNNLTDALVQFMQQGMPMNDPGAGKAEPSPAPSEQAKAKPPKRSGPVGKPSPKDVPGPTITGVGITNVSVGGSSDTSSSAIVPLSPTPMLATTGGTTCPGCSTTFSQFRASGLLGCAECYRVFEAQLSPLLARAHEGGTHHVGKRPASGSASMAAAGQGDDRTDPGESAVLLSSAASSGGPEAQTQRPIPSAQEAAELGERRRVLKRRLQEAVAAEQYERAAKLRDELARLGSDGAGASA
jgi:protein-arginine kinase activator protein McsA